MAVILISESAACRFAANSLSAPTELYYYYDILDGHAESEATIGRRSKTGALVDGEVTNWFQALGVSNNAVDLNSAVLEEDDDANSPYKGKLRLKFTVGATAP